MAAKSLLTAKLKDDIKRIGMSTIQSWFRENQLSISTPKDTNFYDALDNALSQNAVTIDQLNHAIAEMEENSDKKIFLMRAKNFVVFEKQKTDLLRDLKKKFGYIPSDKNWITGEVRRGPTFIYLFWEDGLLKIKFGEMQFDSEADFENSTFNKDRKSVV